MKKGSKKNKRVSIVIFKLLLILVVSGLSLIPIFKELNYGLDLQGGFEILYDVKDLEGKKANSDELSATYKSLIKRIDILGVSEPNISIEGDNKIRIQLAGVTNQESARELLSTVANISFRDTDDKLLMNADVIASTKVGRHQTTGEPIVEINIKDNDKFYDVTSKLSQKEDNKMVTWLDFDPMVDSYAKDKDTCNTEMSSKCLSAASVNEGLSGNVFIEGSFTTEEATSLSELINSGSMPTKLTEISSRTVDASFGVDSLNKTLIAGAIGILLIMVVITIIYRLSGLVASISMVIYTTLVFLVFYLIGGVLTLPGIAALVLGIGMAVDASVISFERIKDELKIGRDVKTAFKEGNKRSFTTILDANITTLIVAVILFLLGESSVKGFATMLIINIIVTILSMVFINRALLHSLIKTNKFNNKIKLLFGMKTDKINNISEINKLDALKNTRIKFDFVKGRKKFFALSSLIIIAGIVFTYFNGFNLSVDYKGGSSITISSENKININEIEKYLSEYKVNDISYVNDNNIYVKVDKTLEKEKIEEIKKHFSDEYAAKTDVGVISNIVKKELTKNAILSVIIASIGIIIYVSLRFSFNYGFSAIVALLHDVLFVVAIFSIFRLEVSTLFIAAVLAIIGYSINDTIVSFDRIRENIKNLYDDKISNKNDLLEVVNLSIRQTFTRSLITTTTTILPVITLLLFGTYQIYTFNVAMFVGLIIGTYSSIFIASQLWLELEKKNIKRGRKSKKIKLEDDELEEKVITGIND